MEKIVIEIKENERLDDLQRDGLMIIQNPEKFCFGIDAVLLSDFAKAGSGDKVLDLGTGTGIIPLLMSSKTKAKCFSALEIQEESADMARRSVSYNKLQEKINIITGDIKDAKTIFGQDSFNVVTSNPPYMIDNHGLKNPDEPKAIARHEIKCSLSDVVKSASAVLVNGGHFYMVHRPFRLAEIICTMREYKLEPKRMRLVYPFADKEPNIVLIEGIKGSNPRMTVEPPLIIYKKPGEYTEETLSIYYE